MGQGPNVPYTLLDQNQILQRVFDETTDKLRVDTAVSVVMGQAEVLITQADDSIRLGDGTNLVTATIVGGDTGLDINVLNLPPGAATSVLQISGNSSLLSIDTKTPALGQAAMAASTPVVIASNQSSILTSVIGTGDNGLANHLTVTRQGHLEVEIKAPVMPFGSVHVESMNILCQSDGVYGINAGQNTLFASGSGASSGANALLTVSTGTTVNSKSQIESRKRLRYRPGQGLVARYTAMFPSGGVASSEQFVGLDNEENCIGVGYSGTSFGIIYKKGGKRQINTLTITTKSSTAESITITLNSVAYSVPVTNGASTAKTAYEISTFASYVNWKAMQVGSTVVFVSDIAGVLGGTFTLSGAATAVGTFATTLAGVATTDLFIAKSSWNGDTLDGSNTAANPSGFTIDTTKLNIFQIGVQYLGAGVITLDVATITPKNDFNWTRCHTILNPNSLTTPNFSNPVFPWKNKVLSTGSTTNLTVSSASYCLFIEGRQFLQGNRFTFQRTITTVTSAAYQCLFTIRADLTYQTKASQVVVNIMSISAGIKHTNAVTFFLIKNATLAGTPQFSLWSSAKSNCSYDTSATTCTFADNDQIMWSGQLGPDGNQWYDLFTENEHMALQPGETFTVAAVATTGTPAFVTASLNTREDQ